MQASGIKRAFEASLAALASKTNTDTGVSLGKGLRGRFLAPTRRT
jgi:hypothetical protein